MAVADTNTLTEDESGLTSGNLITGPGTDTDIDIVDTLSVSNVSRGVLSITPDGDGETIAGAYGTLTVFADGTYDYDLNETLPAVQALTDDDSLTETFNYTVSDGHGGSSSATLTLTIDGINTTPTLTLGAPSGNIVYASEAGFADIEAVAGSGALIQDAGAAEPENKITTIEVTLSSGYQSGTYVADGDDATDTGERVQLDALGEFALSLLGGTASYDDVTGVLTISFPASITAAQATQVLQHVVYTNEIGDFSLDVAPDDTRTISVRVQDEDGAWSTPTSTTQIDLAADVVDSTGLDNFIGSSHDDFIEGLGGNDVIDGGAGDDLVGGGTGLDMLRGGAGDDDIFGDSNSDVLTGDAGSDFLSGGTGGAFGDAVDYAPETGTTGGVNGDGGVIVNLSGISFDVDSVDAIYDPTGLDGRPHPGSNHRHRHVRRHRHAVEHRECRRYDQGRHLRRHPLRLEHLPGRRGLGDRRRHRLFQ